jgi:hypothetical protein
MQETICDSYGPIGEENIITMISGGKKSFVQCYVLDSGGTAHNPAVGSYEPNNGHPRSIKCQNFLEQLRCQ